ncbi:MAG: hypothetical protein LBQ83_02810 [Candidatus Margulisbacteria bacterium]|jgi:hypothetical protein|nr:hypothetical protein [Candidatus Margulisiibacteriota bacterium]
MLYRKVINFGDLCRITDNHGLRRDSITMRLRDGTMAEIKIHYEAPRVVSLEEDVLILIPNGHTARIETIEFYDRGIAKPRLIWLTGQPRVAISPL